jgi:hypothetical protein
MSTELRVKKINFKQNQMYGILTSEGRIAVDPSTNQVRIFHGKDNAEREANRLSEFYIDSEFTVEPMRIHVVSDGYYSGPYMISYNK